MQNLQGADPRGRDAETRRRRWGDAERTTRNLDHSAATTQAPEALRLIAAAAGEAQQKEKQVDEVQVE
ncbi:MAG TPA: hypothetical protein VFH15_00150 [Pyrinomonadaceae bacterium]|nr:hypothetical protein [Pyrinomonadaceae bacterium]